MSRPIDAWADVPACPVWCNLPDDHDLPVRQLPVGAMVTRDHIGEFLPEEIGMVALTRVDEHFVGGPTLIGQPKVEIDSLMTPLTLPGFRRLVDELCRIVGTLADFDLGDVAAVATELEDER